MEIVTIDFCRVHKNVPAVSQVSRSQALSLARNPYPS